MAGWARLIVYVALAGAVTGATLGVAVFGLPVAFAEGQAREPHPLVARVLEAGLALDDAAVVAGVVAAGLLALVAALDLGRRDGGRRQGPRMRPRRPQ